MKAKHELTAEAVRKVIGDGKPASMTQLAHQLGYKGSVSSTLTNKLRALLPEIDSLLAANKPAGDGKTDARASTATKPSAKAKGGKPKLPPRHPQNPYREGISYGCVLDLLAQSQFLDKGINRVDLVKLAASATGKDLKRAGYDIIVVCSPEDTSPTCHRHRSAREGYGVEKINGWVKLVLPASAAKETP